MTIRAKLALNVGTVILIIAGIVLASTRGMRSVQGNIWALTQKSTPFQLKTIELEKAIQATVGALGSANNAGSVEELKAHRTEADRCLGEVKRVLDELKSLSGGQGSEVHAELSATAKELIEVADTRLKAQEEAEAASRAAQERLTAVLAQLKALDERINKIQKDTGSRFQAAVQGMRESTASARDIEALKLTVATTRVILFQIAKAESKDALMIFSGKAAGELERVGKNPYLEKNTSVREGIEGFSEKVKELIAKKGAWIEKPSDELRQDVENLATDADAYIADTILITRDDSAKYKNHYESEARRQEEAFKVLNSANSVLVGDMELGSLGRTMDALSARLAAASTAAQVDGIEAELKELFERLQAVGKRLSATLAQLQAKGELPLVNMALAGLEGIRVLVAGEGGMAAKVRRSLELNDKARQMSKHLVETAARQAEKSRKTVQSARGDQEQAITAVNESLRNNMALVLWSGAVAVFFGLTFGFWIYRSVSAPLRALSRVASAVESTGDFSLRSEARGRDEVALTVRAFNRLLDSLNRVLGDVNRVMADLARGDLRSSVQAEARGDLDSLKQSINNTVISLRQTITTFRQQAKESSAASSEAAKAVDQVASGSREQLDAVSRLAAAIQETGATVRDIAANADIASNRARGSLELVQAGRTKVADMSRAMNAISANSDKISAITGLIIDIADQTSLLALNAAIEAARAGEHGRGFAVVADEVTKLSERVTGLAKDISSVIGASVKESGIAVREANEVRTAMDRIAGSSEEIDDMLHRVATAIEQQNATVAAIGGDVTTLNEIADANAASSEQLASSLARLAEVAEATNRQVASFQT